jgi:hypothetical protein
MPARFQREVRVSSQPDTKKPHTSNLRSYRAYVALTQPLSAHASYCIFSSFTCENTIVAGLIDRVVGLAQRLLSYASGIRKKSRMFLILLPLHPQSPDDEQAS